MSEPTLKRGVLVLADGRTRAVDFVGFGAWYMTESPRRYFKLVGYASTELNGEGTPTNGTVVYVERSEADFR